MKFKYLAGAASSVGCVRTNNEDNFFINGKLMETNEMDAGGTFYDVSDGPVCLYAVCDGMGGEQCGELASYTAVNEMRPLFSAMANTKDIEDDINEYVMRANSAVYSIREGKSGTTLTLLAIKDGVAWVAHLGDSRVYLLRDGKLTRMTTDHSEINRMLQVGIISPEEAKTHPLRHAIHRYLGMPPEGAPEEPSYCDEIKLRGGERFILVSDGITDMLTDEDILKAIRGGEEDPPSALVKAALDAGGKDNATVVYVEVNKIRKGLWD